MGTDKLKVGSTKAYRENYDKIYAYSDDRVKEEVKEEPDCPKCKKYVGLLIQCFDYLRGKKTEIPLHVTLKKILKDKV